MFFFAALALIVAGSTLWFPRQGETSTANSDLGLTLLGGGLALAAGGVVSYAVFMAERRFDAALRASDEVREATQRASDEARQLAAERTNLQLALGQISDLEGIDLGGRDLARFVLRDKSMDQCNLGKSNLDGADFSKSSLRRAELTEASMRGGTYVQATLAFANLRGVRGLAVGSRKG